MSYCIKIRVLILEVLLFVLTALEGYNLLNIGNEAVSILLGALCCICFKCYVAQHNARTKKLLASCSRKLLEVYVILGTLSVIVLGVLYEVNIIGAEVFKVVQSIAFSLVFIFLLIGSIVVYSKL